ncbi:type IX secretion system periplasmic lipoprotein PorW/SprE [Chitinophaga rhizophila]|uniref:Tetratricopeptide repeat protein n=1 Tax=Chitinophaga rhizophila TaxID=2866212 RepID=A0ABS7GCW1_9BACT|nr:tetratricopeptide repeat protein [Chitinophaga rhizophila]MBW8685171.1 tetratricopeptide repeat protein [Chitinophaga rhizophila]
MQKPLVPKVAQPKPENRRPPAELLAERRWTIKRKLVQNMLARYNYLFNARKKLRLITHNVSRQGQDNYNYLLPFYPYSLQNLGLSAGDLDTVIEKASINIQIHDPRSKWIDDSYLVIGQAYFYQGEWDKANRTFLFINTTYAPKKKSDYKAVVGSTAKDQLSIASREKRKPPFGYFKHTYARNDAFVWRAKTLLEMKEFDEARSMMNILEQDPYFPKRLAGDMAEIRAYALYKQERFAEVINPLQTAVKSRRNRDERARMYYILGQLYTNYSRPDSAVMMFHKVIKQKPDPIMDFQARMQIAKLDATREGGSLDESLARLKRMVRKEKYMEFRDAIYYTMANLVLPKDADLALEYLRQSLKVESSNTMQKALSFKGIADIYYGQRRYRLARNFYDSTATVMPPEFTDSAIVNKRKRVLNDVAIRVEAIQREDSLQRIAAMPESDRMIFLEKMAGQMRREAEEKAKKEREDAERGIDPQLANNPLANNMINNNSPATPNKDDQGEWYFYNSASKATGYSEFKKRWGNRPLADNWRRTQGAAISANQALQPEDENGNPIGGEANKVSGDSASARSLAAGLPLTPDDLLKSNVIVEDAYYDLGKLYNDQLDNTELAIETYDTLLNRYPQHPHKTEVVYSLYIWHTKLGHTALAAKYKQNVVMQYGDSKFANIIKYGALQDINEGKKKEISTSYDSVYVNFQRGNYAAAYDMKKAADSAYGLNFMQPKFDLLEAMIIMRMDTCEYGRQAVVNVINKYKQEDAVQEKAKSLLEALDNRAALVVYLSRLEIEKKNDNNTAVDENISIRYPWQKPEPKFESEKIQTAKADSVKVATANAGLKVAPLPAPIKPVTIYKLKADNPHFVVMYFLRTNKAAIEEALTQFTRYNAEKHGSENIQVANFVLTQQDVMLIFRLFPNEDKALDYYDEVRYDAEKIAPRIRPSDYTMFIISRDNFIQMNSTKDVEGYRKFFNDNYVTQ